MGVIRTILGLLAIVDLLMAERYGVLKYVPLCSGTLLLTGFLSFTTTKRTERPAPVSTGTRTETLYVTENGTRVRRVLIMNASGRCYYVEVGRTIYIDHCEY
jgi:hypothetical protein